MAPGFKSTMFMVVGILLWSSSSAQEFECEPNKFRCANSNCIPMTWVCDYENDCGDGSDEKNCLTLTCAPDEYQCPNGLCIRSTWVCDGDADCQDEADEEDCSATTCKPDEYRCKEGGCIKQLWVCDGTKDCKEGDDEADCAYSTCTAGMFLCENSNKCIPKSYVCDGDPDCDDGSDEYFVGCSAPTCSPEFFTCKNNKCIPSTWHCDHTDDCGDKSDEEFCDFKTTEKSLITTKGRTTKYATTTMENLLVKTIVVATKKFTAATVFRKKPTAKNGSLAQAQVEAHTRAQPTTVSDRRITEDTRPTTTTSTSRITEDTRPTTTTSTSRITEDTRPTTKYVTIFNPRTNATVKFIVGPTRRTTSSTTTTTHAPFRILSSKQRIPITYFYPSPTKEPRCGGILTSSKGVIQSPNFPQPYPRNSDCKWIISLPKVYHVITILIETMFLELDQNCAYDYLMFLDKLYNQVGCRHCGSYVQPKVLDIKGHVAIVEFHSDHNHGKRGFRLRYNAHWNF